MVAVENQEVRNAFAALSKNRPEDLMPSKANIIVLHMDASGGYAGRKFEINGSQVQQTPYKERIPNTTSLEIFIDRLIMNNSGQTFQTHTAPMETMLVCDFLTAKQLGVVLEKERSEYTLTRPHGGISVYVPAV